MAIPFVDVHPQTIAATLAVRSIPEAETQAVVVILVWCIRSSLGNKGPTYADLLLCFKHECVFLSFWKASE